MADEEISGNVNVLCRFRPLNPKELQMSEQLCVEFPPDRQTVLITQSDSYSGPLRFNLDFVFTPDSPQIEVYAKAGKPIVEAVMKGFNGTVFAYGQTSSGKTFTMSGPDIEDVDLMGIIPRMVTSVFEQIEQSDEHVEFSVKVAYAELYLEKIRDLIDPSKQNLNIHEDKNRGVYIADLTETYVSSEIEVYNLMKTGSDNREVAYTNMNAGSSRSHSIFILTISQTNTLDYSSKTGKLYLVDLAGSEKVGKTGAEGKRLEEAKNINKSLTTLGLVIFNLTDGKSSHIPYRDSKLTRVLQDSLGGNSKTSLIVTCSPSPYNEAETISTLRFGIRAKAIKNKPKVNREYTVAELKLLVANAKEELNKRDRLISKLEHTMKENGMHVAGYIPEEEPSPKLSESDQSAVGDLIAELEAIRTRLSQEVSEHSALKLEVFHMTKEHEVNMEDLSNFTQLCNLQKTTIENYTSKMEESDGLIEELKAAQETLDNEMNSLTTKKLELEQQVTGKIVEAEQLRVELQMQETRRMSVTPANNADELRNRLSREVTLHTQLEERHSILQDQVAQVGPLEASFKLASELESSERQRWLNLRLNMERDLKNSKDRAFFLKNELDLAKESFNFLNNAISEGSRCVVKKNEALERNLEQLTLMYHQLNHQKRDLKLDKQVNERRIVRLTEKNKVIDEQLKKLRAKYAGEQQNVRALEEQLVNFESMGYRGSVCMTPTTKHIKKTIKGGGGKGAALLFSPRYQLKNPLE